MRELADIIKDADHVQNLILIELLVGQAIALAAYRGTIIDSLDSARAAVFEVARYPMLNLVSGEQAGEAAARRVAFLVGVKLP